jgi:uncharacterized protein YecE (DUF72 family)
MTWPADDAQANPVYVGTSGWSYSHWENVLYPPGLPVAQRLGRYVQAFSTVELNASFYRWPKAETFAGWHRRLPPGFLLSVKAPRGLTHAKRLYAPEAWVERLVTCWQLLADRRGVLLVQLPPQLARDDARLEYLLKLLPEWMRVAVEFRHPSWLDDQVFELLSRHRAAYVVMSGAKLPCVLKATAPFVYVRMHGPDPDHLYGGSYSDADLGWWADRIHDWQRLGHSVFVYFNNDGGGNAVHNAWTLRSLLGT